MIILDTPDLNGLAHRTENYSNVHVFLVWIPSAGIDCSVLEKKKFVRQSRNEADFFAQMFKTGWKIAPIQNDQDVQKI